MLDDLVNSESKKQIFILSFYVGCQKLLLLRFTVGFLDSNNLIQ